ELALLRVPGAARAVGEDALEDRPFGRDEATLGLDEVPEVRGEAGDASPGEVRKQLGDAKRRQGIAPAERQKLGHRCYGGRKAGLYAAGSVAKATAAGLVSADHCARSSEG